MPLNLLTNLHPKIVGAVFYDSPIAIFIVDNRGLIKNANKCAIELVEKNEEEILLQTIFDLFPKIDMVFPKVWWQKIYYKNNKEINSFINNSHGEKIPLKIITNLNVDNDLHVIYVAKITEFKPLKNDIIKSEDKLIAYFNYTSDLIVILSLQKTILSFNHLFEHYSKVVYNKQVNEGDNMIDYIVPESKNDFHKNFDTALTGKELNFEKEINYNGLSLWWNISYMPIRNTNGDIQSIAFVLKNIDDRKVAEEALIKSEERFKLVVAGLNEGWWDWDLVNNNLYYSPRWWNNIGYEANELVNIPSYWEKLIHPNDIENVQKKFNDALASNNQTYEIEYRAKHKDGHFIPMFSRGFFLRDEAGKVIRVSGSDMDLTERKQSEFLLLENQRKLQIAQKLAFLGNYEIDIIDFKFNASQTAYEILGIEDNFIKTVEDFKKLIFPEDFNKVQYYYEKTISDQSVYTCEYRIVNNKTGEIRWISDFSNIEYNENNIATRVIGAIQDITERKNIEFDIQKNDIKYRNLIENMDLGILEVDNDEIILKAYPKFCELVGYTENELIGKSAIDIFLPKTESTNFKNATTGRDQGSSNAYELQILNKNGEPINVIISGTPLFDETGKIVGSIGIHYNISEQKKNEADLKKSFNLVSEQNKRLLSFSYIVSHNLRSHSSNITSLLAILSASNSEQEKTEIIGHLSAVSNLLNETLSNLNEVVSIQNNLNVVIETININEQINRVLILLSSQIEQKNVQIINEISNETTVNFNPAYFESMLYNLISNGIKYSKPNETSIVKISSAFVNNKLVLTIEDNGIGIDLNKNGDKLFGMYKTFNGNSDARGLGLFITKDQIEVLGGKINVTSELGVGTTFQITFK